MADTRNRAEQRAARARQKATGEPYTMALRKIREERAKEIEMGKQDDDAATKAEKKKAADHYAKLAREAKADRDGKK